MYVVNGISSDICQRILPKFLNKNRVIGFYRTKYKGLLNKNLKLLKITQLNSIDNYIKTNEKIVFMNFAAYNHDSLFINLKKNKISSIIKNNLEQPIDILIKIIPIMMKFNYGRIIFFSSTDALNGTVGASIYSASKTSLIGLSNSLSKEYSRFNITSNIISLGYFNTKLWNSLSEKDKKKRLSNTLSKETINIQSVYDLIRTVSKNKAINKSTIFLDDGI